MGISSCTNKESKTVNPSPHGSTPKAQCKPAAPLSIIPSPQPREAHSASVSTTTGKHTTGKPARSPSPTPSRPPTAARHSIQHQPRRHHAPTWRAYPPPVCYSLPAATYGLLRQGGRAGGPTHPTPVRSTPWVYVRSRSALQTKHILTWAAGRLGTCSAACLPAHGVGR